MQPVRFSNIRISTGYAQNSPRSLDCNHLPIFTASMWLGSMARDYVEYIIWAPEIK